MGKIFPLCLIALYGAACFGGYWMGSSDHGFVGYFGISLIVLTVLFVQFAARMVMGIIIASVVAVVHVALAASVFLAPLAFLGALIVLLLFIGKITKFVLSFPFLVACVITCAYVAYVPVAARNASFTQTGSSAAMLGWGIGVAVLGTVVMLTCIVAGRWLLRLLDADFIPSFGRATLLTMGWGWFALLFLVSIFTPHDVGDYEHESAR